MEGSAFDRIARLLAAPVSRRSGLIAAIGAAVGIAAADDPAAAGRRRRKRRPDRSPDRSPKPEGPCGDGSRKDNVCTSDKQCCTGFCNMALARSNDDGKGRCRCVRKGKSCTGKSICCSGVCVDGRCSNGAAIAAPCTAKAGCASSRATCTPYGGTSTTGAFCLLKSGVACVSNSQCVTNACVGGFCAACSCAACSLPCTPDVCPTCAHRTVQAAIDAAPAGTVVNIAPGTYVEDIEIARPLTLRACRAAGNADPVVVRNATYCRTIDVTDGAALDLIDITVEGYHDIGTSNWGGGVATDGDLRLCGRTVIRDGAWDNGGGVALAASGRTLLITDNAQVRENYAGGNGGGVHVTGESDIIVSGSALIAVNQAVNSWGGGIYAENGANVSVTGAARFHANRARDGGGLAHRRGASTREYEIHVTDDAKFTANVATIGDGGAIAAKIWCNPNYIPALLMIDGNAELSGNSAGYDGGAISNCAVPTVIQGNAVISGNLAGSTSSIAEPRQPINGKRGGAIWMSGGSSGWPAGTTGLTLAGNAAIRENSAVQAGAVYLDDTAAVLSGAAMVSANTASDEGGAFLLDVKVLAPSSVTLSGQATITGNTAPSGGGVYSMDANNTLSAPAGSITGNLTDNCAGLGISC